MCMAHNLCWHTHCCLESPVAKSEPHIRYDCVICNKMTHVLHAMPAKQNSKPHSVAKAGLQPQMWQRKLEHGNPHLPASLPTNHVNGGPCELE
jgi:hypothetical protein